MSIGHKAPVLECKALTFSYFGASGTSGVVESKSIGLARFAGATGLGSARSAGLNGIAEAAGAGGVAETAGIAGQRGAASDISFGPAPVLQNVNFRLALGERVAVVGASGSGKSTLLHLVAGLERPTSGEIHVAGVKLSHLTEQSRTRFRSEHLGIVFQAFHLIPTLTAWENVALPLELAGLRGTQEAYQQALERLRAVGLQDKAERYPEQLSGGEQQRVAIARALVHRPALILADEPTGNLDSRTGEAVFELLLEQVEASQGSLLMVTHSDHLARRLDRTVRMVDGQLQD